jgi:nucleoside-diphosphate-sugar epimerase
MNYLITGGTGFIGSYLTKQLLADGANTVVCFDYAPNPEVIQQKVSQAQMNQVKIVKGDTSDDNKALIRICEENEIEKIIHLAGLLAAESELNPFMATKINCIGTLNVFETARILSLKKVVWASSISVYGTPAQYDDEFLPNDAPHLPSTIYGMTKSFSEYMGRHYYNKYNLDTLGLRYSTIYGVGRLRGSGVFTTELIEKPALGREARVPHGDDAINWLYIEDAARATILAAESLPTKSRALVIGGDWRPIAEVREYVMKLLPDSRIELLPGHYDLASKYDLSAAEKEIQYKPQWSMERGVKENINQIRKANGLPIV